MKYTRLGKNGPEVSTVSFGAWGISGRDWGKTNEEESKKALHAALDHEVNFIDTADVYGFGHSEELIHEVLKERGEIGKVVIATKAGNNFYPFINQNPDVTPANPDYSEEHLKFAVEQSLRRLGVESLDILQLHSPQIEILERDEPWEALTRLKQEGKIKHAGWSVQSFQETVQAHILERHHDLIDVIQVRYNLLERELLFAFLYFLDSWPGNLILMPHLIIMIIENSIFPGKKWRSISKGLKSIRKFFESTTAIPPLN